LADIGNSRAVEPLIEIFNKGSWGTSEQEAAAKALGRLKDARAVEPLIKVLGNEYKNRVQYIAGKQYPDHYDGRSAFRANAAEALGLLNDARAVEILIKVLNDDIGNVRQKAAEALGRLKDARAIAPLQKLRNDEVSDVRAAADTALINMGDKPPLEPLFNDLSDRDWNKRLAAVEALGRTRDVSVFDSLAGLLTDDNIRVCKAAVKAVKDINKDEAEKIIKNICNTRHYFNEWVLDNYREVAGSSHRECVRCGAKEICTEHIWGSVFDQYNDETDRTIFFRACMTCGAKNYVQ
jgi:HEAT repeat protein